MPREIERKLLVRSEAWKQVGKPVRITQGYLSRTNERVVRVRLAGGKGSIAVKGRAQGPRRKEFEYEIPAAHAAEMLDQICERPLLDKLRHRVSAAGISWAVDEFLGENAGLVIACVELARDGNPIALPDWIGAEITDDPRYNNNHLVSHPFSPWK